MNGRRHPLPRPVVRVAAREHRPVPLGPSLVLLSLLVLLVTASARGDAAERRTFDGDWQWTGGARGELEAHFDAREDGRWDVAFHFEFRRRPHVYEGIATGDPGRGPVGGTVRTADGRTFSFEGRFRDGRFEGEHAEVFRGGKKQETGTLALRPPAPAATAL